ncbi:MAG: DUF2726 domain-containing protein [Anaerolineales bacterium]|nr:DUF2726 domain-containing protein [Anaerolineales bacterium]
MAASTNQKQGCASILLPFLRRAKDKTPAEVLPYRLRDDFLSPAELSFYKVLSSLMTGSRLVIQVKVGLGDLFYVIRPNENHAYMNKIRQKHVDFLICDSATMRPLLAIELDDSSHDQPRRQARDEFVDQAFQSANFPLLHIPAQREYNTQEITARIAPLLKASMNAPIKKSEPSSLEAAPVCPKCGIPMVVRTAAQGAHKGEQFYGCPNYPRCRETRMIS